MKEFGDFDYQTKCRIIRKLASGGMGDVYLAEQLGVRGFKKTVAIKTIHTELLKNEQSLNMFISEAKLVADLVHENIGHVFNLCQTGEDVVIIMEYIKGITLSTFIRQHKAKGIMVDPDMSAFIGSRVARALSYAHTRTNHEGVPLKIVHRDVTPANIMIDTLGVVKLTDFGIAKAVTGDTLDERHFLMGKYPYMSPEQVQLKGTDARSDIFSLGLVMYETLLQKRLFNAKSRDELIKMHESVQVEPPSAVSPWINPELSDAVMEMLAQDIAHRVPSARKIVLKLEMYMYEGGYGPTNEKLARYIKRLFGDK